MTWHDPMGRQVIRSSPKHLSHGALKATFNIFAFIARPAPPQETRRAGNPSSIKQLQQTLQIPGKSVKFLPATLITCPCIQLRWAVRHFTSIGGRECTSPLFMLVSGNTMHLLSWHVPIWWEVILSSPFVFSWLVAFFSALRTKTVEEVDVGYLNP